MTTKQLIRLIINWTVFPIIALVGSALAAIAIFFFSMADLIHSLWHLGKDYWFWDIYCD